MKVPFRQSVCKRALTERSSCSTNQLVNCCRISKSILCYFAVHFVVRACVRANVRACVREYPPICLSRYNNLTFSTLPSRRMVSFRGESRTISQTKIQVLLWTSLLVNHHPYQRSTFQPSSMICLHLVFGLCLFYSRVHYENMSCFLNYTFKTKANDFFSKLTPLLDANI